MSDVKKLTFEDRKEIEKLKDQKITNQELAIQLGVNIFTIKNEFCRSGGRKNYTAENAQQAFEKRKINHTLSYQFRKGNKNTLTLEDRKNIEKYKYSDLSGEEIGKLIGRQKNVVNREFKLFPRREDYNAEKSQEISQKVKEEKYAKLRKDTLLNNSYFVTEKPELLIDKEISTDFINNPSLTIQSNLPSYIPRMPLKIWIDRYKEEYAPKRIYWRKEVKYFEFWLRCLGDKIAVDISPLEIETCADEVTKKISSKNKQTTLSHETRRKYLLMLSSLYTTAIKEWKWALFNPLSSIDMKQKVKTGYKVCSQDFTKSHQDLRQILSDAVYSYMKENKITRREGARKANISFSIFQRVLNPNINVTMNTFCKVCESYGIKLVIG